MTASLPLYPDPAASIASSTSEFAEQVAARLATVTDFGRNAEHLANLFRQTFPNHERAITLRNCLQTTLLKATVDRAAAEMNFYAAPVYRDWIAVRPGEPPDLSCWPIIKRSDLTERFDDFLSRVASYAFTCHTSGSTGKPLSIYKSSEEIGFIRRYFTTLLGPSMRSSALLPLSLSFPNLYHGVGIPVPTPGKVFVSGVTDDTLIQDAAEVLRTEYNIRGHEKRISVISGLVFHVQFFTSYLLERGFDLKSFGVRSINLSGGAVANSVRRFIADAWGALVFDRYSLTEIFGGGYRCFRCGHFHLDPHVIGEVVDVDTEEVIEEGVGRLVLTSLYPFVQMQPTIRYDPGDLVRRVRTNCGPSLAFDFLGKEKNCIRWKRNGTSEWLLFSVDLFESLGELPDVNVYEWFRNVTVVHDRTVGARQLYVVAMKEGQPPTIELNVELRYAPHCFPARVEELRRRILFDMRRATTVLAARMDSGELRVDIRFHGPGALGNQFIIKT